MLYAAIGILCSLNFRTFLFLNSPIYFLSAVIYDIKVNRKLDYMSQDMSEQPEDITVREVFDLCIYRLFMTLFIVVACWLEIDRELELFFAGQE